MDEREREVWSAMPLREARREVESVERRLEDVRRQRREIARRVLVRTRILRLMEAGGCPDDMTASSAVAAGRIAQAELDQALNPTDAEVEQEAQRLSP